MYLEQQVGTINGAELLYQTSCLFKKVIVDDRFKFETVRSKCLL